MGPDALTKDLLTEAREIERKKYGWVVGEERRIARKQGRAEPWRTGGEEERQAKARARGEVEGDAAAALLGKVRRKSPRVAALRAAEEEAMLERRRAEVAAGSTEVPMEHGSEEEDEAGGEEERGARGAEDRGRGH